MKKILSIALLSVFYAGAQALAADISIVKECFFKKDYACCIREGARLLSAAKQNERNLDELYYLLGLSYLKTEDYDNGFECFKKVKLESSRARLKEQALLGMGDCYFAKADFVLAEYEYKQLIDNHPQTKLKPAAYYRLSQLFERTGNSQQQKEYAERLKKEFPKSPEASLKVELFPKSRLAQAKILKVLPPQEDVQIPVNESKASVDEVDIIMPKEGIFCVQVGAFSKELNAKNLAQKLKDKNYPAYVEQASLKDRIIYKVRIGKFPSRAQAKKMQTELSGLGYPTKIFP